MDEYKIEKGVLEGVEMAEKHKKRKSMQKCDWSDAREVKLMREEDRKVKRCKLLDKTVPKRVCPKCKRRIWLDSSWIVQDGMAWCKSCWYVRSGSDKVVGSFISDHVVRYKVDGPELKRLRELAGIGLLIFSEKMGWTSVYQLSIERGEVVSLSEEHIERMVEVFEEVDVVITDKTK